MNFVKSRRIAAIALICLPVLSCSKEAPQIDYRDKWVGTYHYDLELHSWWMVADETIHDTSTVHYYSGNLIVSAGGDSNVSVADPDRETLEFKVSENGILAFNGQIPIGPVPQGRFFGEDSLYYEYAYVAHGGGSSYHYYCKKTSNQP